MKKAWSSALANARKQDGLRVAALFVDGNGCYAGLSSVDVWDIQRDARTYAGPLPVVAHPPCNRWAMPLAKVNQTRYGHKIGDDGGCFASALRSVIRWGGVLEHPANSWAFAAYELAKPKRGSWQRTRDGWVTEVSQSAYGHRARKRTWLFTSVDQPPLLDWSEPAPTAVTSWLQRTNTTLPRLSKRAASATPIEFRDLLLSIARSAYAGRQAA